MFLQPIIKLIFDGMVLALEFDGELMCSITINGAIMYSQYE